MDRLVHWSELESLADSVFSMQKADRVIVAATEGHDPDLDELTDEHMAMEYRLVPRELLHNLIYTLKHVNREYAELMEFAVKLRTPEGRAEVDRAEAALDRALRGE